MTCMACVASLVSQHRMSSLRSEQGILGPTRRCVRGRCDVWDEEVGAPLHRAVEVLEAGLVNEQFWAEDGQGLASVGVVPYGAPPLRRRGPPRTFDSVFVSMFRTRVELEGPLYGRMITSGLDRGFAWVQAPRNPGPESPRCGR